MDDGEGMGVMAMQSGSSRSAISASSEMIVEPMLLNTVAAVGRAVDQISKRRYYQGLRGDVLLVGMVFCGKVPMIRSKRVSVGSNDRISIV